MNKYSLIGGSICAVVLIVLASLTIVVGFQTVQASNQKIITTEINEKDLLFQTIADMANNREIQKVIIGSQLTGKRLFESGLGYTTFRFPVNTEKILKSIYTIGVILFRILDKSKIYTTIEHHPVMSQGIQKELSAVIEKDANLKSEMTQLSSLSCDCNNDNPRAWNFTILCTSLLILFVFFGYLAEHMPYGWVYVLLFLIMVCIDVAKRFHCDWPY